MGQRNSPPPTNDPPRRHRGLTRKPRTANQEPQTKNRKPRTANQEPQTKNRKPRTANQESLERRALPLWRNKLRSHAVENRRLTRTDDSVLVQGVRDSLRESSPPKSCGFRGIHRMNREFVAPERESASFLGPGLGGGGGGLVPGGEPGATRRGIWGAAAGKAAGSWVACRYGLVFPASAD